MSLGCAAASAHADSITDYVRIEAGIGGSGYSNGGDGYWVQEGFEHKLQLTAPAFEVGLTGPVYQSARWGVDWHADWAWLGSIHTQSMATPNDDNYNVKTKGCNGPCWPLANFVGAGHEQGFILSLEPYYRIGPWRLGVEAGPFIHHSAWTETITGWVPSPTAPSSDFSITSTDGWRVGMMVGASVSRGPFSIAYQHFITKTSGSNAAPPIWHSVDMLMAKYRF